VKTSFVRYVRTIAAGTCEALDGAELGDDGVFRFPLEEASKGPDGWELRFGGRARFHAHHGFLDVDLRRLQPRPTASGGVLHTEAGVLATLAPAVPVEEDRLVRWPHLVPCLTELGAEIFGNVYPVGTELAPLDASILLD
jgi:hypothetical protein